MRARLLPILAALLLALPIGARAAVPEDDLAATPPPPSLAAPADAAAELGALLGDLQTFQAGFLQFTQDVRGQDLQAIDGQVWVQRPGFFRWHGHAPLNQEIVSDGKRSWFYDIDLQQVIVRDFDPALARTPLLLLSGNPANLQTAFEVHAYNREGERSFDLTPRAADSLIERLELTFQGRELRSIRMNDTLGQRTYIEFQDAIRNAPIDPQRFRFQVPQGVDLIEDYQDP